MLDTVQTKPLLRDLYLGKHLPHMVHQLPPKRLKRHFSHDSTSLQSLIGKWKQAGLILDDKPEIIAGILPSLFLVTLHKQEVGEAGYKETMERLIDLIVDGLVKVEGQQMRYVIETCHLAKPYQGFPAVRDVSLRISKGEIYGFIGLNGAGKTTTIRMLLGMIRPTKGA